MRPEEPKERWKNFRKLYQLYKSDLSLSEIERLIKRDVPGLYEFYGREMEQPDGRRNRLIRSISFIRNFFLAFLLKLTSARRLFYSVSIILFFYGLVTGRNHWMVFAFILLNLLLALEVADKLMAKDELEVAREIQTGLMPKTPPSDLAYDIACFSEPAREVGGDYFDFIRIPDNDRCTYLVVGDVKGKGMAAALYMVRVQALLQYVMDRYRSPANILRHLNKNIRRILRRDYFFSMTVVAIDSQGSLRFARAGHMPMIHYQARTAKVTARAPMGIAVGLENGSRFDRSIEELSLQPETGDVLILYTDGVVETMNASMNQYGDTALQEVILKNSHRPAEQIKEAILTDLAGYRGTAPPHDDLTLIVLKRKRTSETSQVSPH